MPKQRLENCQLFSLKIAPFHRLVAAYLPPLGLDFHTQTAVSWHTHPFKTLPVSSNMPVKYFGQDKKIFKKCHPPNGHPDLFGEQSSDQSGMSTHLFILWTLSNSLLFLCSVADPVGSGPVGPDPTLCLKIWIKTMFIMVRKQKLMKYHSQNFSQYIIFFSLGAEMNINLFFWGGGWLDKFSLICTGIRLRIQNLWKIGVLILLKKGLDPQFQHCSLVLYFPLSYPFLFNILDVEKSLYGFLSYTISVFN